MCLSNVKISSIIYVRNGISYIEKAIRSVMNQTLQEIEILVIDGGSTDGTLDIIEKLKREDNRIQIFHAPASVGAQFNLGLKKAKGEYIGICESDDYILPSMYEKLYEVAKKNDLDVIRSNKVRFCEIMGTESFYQDITSEKDAFYDSIINPSKDIRFLKLGSLGIWSAIYRRDFLLKENIWMNETKGAAYQDTTFAFLAAVKAHRGMLIKDIFYCYRVDNPNSSSNNPERLDMMIKEYSLLKERLKKEGLFEIYKETYLDWKVNACIWFYDFLSNKIKKDFILLFYQDLHNELKNNNYTKEKILLEREKVILSAAEESFDEFERCISKYDANISELKIKLEKIQKDRNIIIFGKGNMGKLVCQYMKCTGRTNLVYTDNNQELWGKEIDGLLIISPEDSIRKFPNGFYVVANVVCAKEIKEQIQRLDIKEENIAVCDNYDVFLKKILLKI